MHTFILLDRSGSMASPAGRWEESLGSINSYVRDLKVDDARITVAVFDSGTEMNYQIIRHASPAKEWRDITSAEVKPNGGTPLLDALVKTIHNMEFVGDSKSVLIVVTDGGENSSKFAKKDEVRIKIEAIKKKDWQVLFIGADFDAFGDAGSVGVWAAQTINTTMGNYRSTMGFAARETQLYASGAKASMDFNADDRKKAVGDKS